MFIAVCLMAGSAASKVHATDGPIGFQAPRAPVQTDLIFERSGTDNRSEVVLGVQFVLDPGWKTYWRSPGDAGIPPQFDWDGSSNIEKVEILWPRPTRIESFGLTTWGYENEVVLPVKLTLADPEKPLQVRMSAYFGVCKDVCIPVNRDLQADLPAGEGDATYHARVISDYRALVPPKATEGTAIHQVTAQIRTKDQISVTVAGSSGFKNPSLILEGEEGDLFTVRDVTYSDNGKKAVFQIEADLARKERSLSGYPLVATIVDGEQAAEADILLE
ncbi:hypothetical protein GCM10007924_08990 [Sneathiella chinensis]|uniref:Thiol:disulfide interchange protein DsbD N-terminal domain-containing protein n=2 Tax=Sneathiella chinensis TaxID=349750 RepID=A0ABQ5U1H8_9PROT|nr:hypothetical protein GCM10007924_08990 [Sneathiella chinensis]